MFIHLRRLASRHRRPPILLNTLPRSGSRFLLNALQKGLGIPGYPALQTFNWQTAEIHETVLKTFIRKRRLSQSHIMPLPYNVHRLSRRLERMIVHLRDPRQATLSYIHLLTGMVDNDPDGLLENVRLGGQLPDGFLDASWERQIDIAIDRFLPTFVAFTAGWTRVHDDRAGSIDILLTSHDELRRSSDDLLRRILDFYGIPESHFAFPPAAVSGELHFRKGEADEWRREFNARQIARANAAMPPGLADRHGWPAS